MPDLLSLYADLDAINSAISLLGWDRQVLMPPGGTEARTAQVGILTRMAHELFTSDEMQRALEDMEKKAESGSEDAAIARVVRRDMDTETKLPLEHVERKSKVSSEAYEVWKQAREASDFGPMLPYYQELFDLNREKAELLGYRNHIYDPLIDLFEEGATYQTAANMFTQIKQPIVDLVRDIRENGAPVDDSALVGDWDKSSLRDFMRATTAQIGFDYNRGRLDVAPNAFCSGTTSSDVRMTTRPSNHLKGILSSSLHEMGHGLYEQGSPARFDRTPLAGGISLAIHESQSRLWENIIGRSLSFWQHFFPKLAAAFPRVAGLSDSEFYRMINKVEPSFIRVGADELTYNLHILVRFELEVEILTGRTRVKDLPEAWNAKYQDYLGITPANDGEGVLQDVHWSRGMVGYFPTYAMGNLIGGQIWERLRADIPDYEDQLRVGDCSAILAWLTDKVYGRARLLPPNQLMNEVVGGGMSAAAWLSYATQKYREIYRLS